MGKEDNACECNVSQNKSHDLEAHAGCTWWVVWETEVTWVEKVEKWGRIVTKMHQTSSTLITCHASNRGGHNRPSETSHHDKSTRPMPLNGWMTWPCQWTQVTECAPRDSKGNVHTETQHKPTKCRPDDGPHTNALDAAKRDTWQPSHASRQAQINSIMDKPEEMKDVQTPITPDGILDNALAMFDRLLDHQKDEFIQRYEGKLQDFPGV